MIKPCEMLDNEHIARLFGLYVRFLFAWSQATESERNLLRLATGDRVRTQLPVTKTVIIFQTVQPKINRFE